MVEDDQGVGQCAVDEVGAAVEVVVDLVRQHLTTTHRGRNGEKRQDMTHD